MAGGPCWLAATLRGDAPAELLDTYERGPVAAAAVDWSRAQVALMRPDQGTRALAAVVCDLIETGDGATYVPAGSGGEELVARL